MCDKFPDAAGAAGSGTRRYAEATHWAFVLKYKPHFASRDWRSAENRNLLILS